MCDLLLSYYWQINFLGLLSLSTWKSKTFNQTQRQVGLYRVPSKLWLRIIENGKPSLHNIGHKLSGIHLVYTKRSLFCSKNCSKGFCNWRRCCWEVLFPHEKVSEMRYWSCLFFLSLLKYSIPFILLGLGDKAHKSIIVYSFNVLKTPFDRLLSLIFCRVLGQVT